MLTTNPVLGMKRVVVMLCVFYFGAAIEVEAASRTILLMSNGGRNNGNAVYTGRRAVGNGNTGGIGNAPTLAELGVTRADQLRFGITVTVEAPARDVNLSVDYVVFAPNPSCSNTDAFSANCSTIGGGTLLSGRVAPGTRTVGLTTTQITALQTLIDDCRYGAANLRVAGGINAEIIQPAQEFQLLQTSLTAVGPDVPRPSFRLPLEMMSLSNTGVEIGDVLWTGSGEPFGSSQGGAAANGNVIVRNSPTLGALGITRADQLRIILEVNEAPNTVVRLTELDIVLYGRNPSCNSQSSSPRGGQNAGEVCTPLLGATSLLASGSVDVRNGRFTFRVLNNSAVQSFIDTVGANNLFLGLEATIENAGVGTCPEKFFAVSSSSLSRGKARQVARRARFR